jgi:uncharacterized repeat protein (TIGR02543 family)
LTTTGTASFTPSATAYYAVFSRTATVSYNANGGSGTTSNSTGTQKYNSNGSIETLNITTASNGFSAPTGKTFNFWGTSNSASSGTTAGNAYNWTPAYNADASTTLYAIWKNATYSVTYNKDSGSITNESNYTAYTYGTGLTLPTPARTWYTFNGWYDNSGLTGTAVTSIGTTETGNKTYWAKWTANSYSVTYNKDSGSIDGESSYTSYTYGTGLTLPTPTRTGYAFGGWYDNSGLTGSAITSIETTATGNKEYWAKWSVIFSVTVPTNITITMDSNGTVTSPSNVKIINNTYAPVEITAVNIIGQNGWSAAAPSADFSATPMNTKQFKLTLNGDTVPAGNASALTLGSGWTYIPANGDGKTEAQHALPLIIDADIARQSEETNAAIANIVFTVNLKAA